MKYILSVICLLSFSFVSCVGEQEWPEEGVGLLTFGTEEVLTRGTPITSGASLQEMGVFGYDTGVGAANLWRAKNGKAQPNLLTNLKVSKQNGRWVPAKNVSWPKKAESNVSFFAYAPYATGANGLVADVSKGGIPQFKYTVPNVCANQPDLMVASLKPDLNVVKHGSSPVVFQMKHALASIGFKGKGVGQIRLIKVIGAKTSGVLTTDGNGGLTWGGLTGSGDFIATLGSNTALNNVNKQLNSGNGFLMMIPQVLPNDARLRVEFVDGRIVEFDLSGQVWSAGQIMHYNLDIKEQESSYNLEFNFVGAFWKGSQTGERLIRFSVAGNHEAEQIGDFQAKVYWTDGKWQAGDIVFSNTPSADPGVTWNRSTEHPADMNSYDANYRVTGNETSVSGKIKNGNIFFRIGLKSTFAASYNNPARYAIIQVKYGKGAWQQERYIYLRQGEYPDYLMRKTEYASGSDLPNRPYANRFSVYNLTAQNAFGSAAYQATALQGARFTAYPSQVGAFYQWGNNLGKSYWGESYWTNSQQYFNNYRHAYHPSLVISTPGWWTNTEREYWNQAYSRHKVCPEGWRRPQDGTISGNIVNDSYYADDISEACEVDDRISSVFSEFKQSLLLQIGDQNTKNSIYGYYADGFFDRRVIVGKGVSTGADVAYVGRLFFNSATGASLFFPSSGYREGYHAGLQHVGDLGRYWSACGYYVLNNYSRQYMRRGLAFEVSPDQAKFMLPFRSEAVTIRCVKE